MPWWLGEGMRIWMSCRHQTELATYRCVYYTERCSGEGNANAHMSCLSPVPCITNLPKSQSFPPSQQNSTICLMPCQKFCLNYHTQTGKQVKGQNATENVPCLPCCHAAAALLNLFLFLKVLQKESMCKNNKQCPKRKRTQEGEYRREV